MTTDNNKYCVAFVFARGGSKGIPRKNLKLLNGQPLITYSIEVAKKCPSIDSVVVSTDDQEIARIAGEYGAEVPFIRPPELAHDMAGEFEAWQHALRYYSESLDRSPDIFVSLPPTSPLRSVRDIELCIATFIESEVDIVITVKKASRSPYFNMVRVDAEGNSVIANLDSNGHRYKRRQDVPVLYDMTTVAYVSSPEFVLKSNSIFDGKVKQVEIPEERAIDIDTPHDFKIAELLLLDSNREIN